ncbi:Putative Endonuclease/exonuclease/phosphatase superfamily [Septoria linicola]|uniref:Endonuclease/exonuclease/phosphatase superfamily n=1 Tax=Septoria linicola TaxID=215465 RepID=A0A9Q9AGH8_9PEZI|nr:Putative Endonuclease/exonuclease/phosphatase superfamily [Septoria linicola]
MDALVQQSIKEVESKKRSSIPWQFDEPWKQSYYAYDGKKWVAKDAGQAHSTVSDKITKLALCSWNIDFMLPFPDSRMKAALTYLQERTTGAEESATAIYLQECVASDIQLIADQPWIQQNFCLSDIGISSWQSDHYGTVTLLDNRLPITSAFRVHYSETRMERDVLITDILLQNRSIRLCNSHLESMAFEPPRRIPQMKLIASYMHSSSVDAAIVAGDFNAIQPFDRTLHSDNNLSDAYIELGGKENDPNGHTWGQQAATVQRERDLARSFERFGRDVLVPDEEEGEFIKNLGFEKAWVTDHLGVEAVFEVQAGEATTAEKL